MSSFGVILLPVMGWYKTVMYRCIVLQYRYATAGWEKGEKCEEMNKEGSASQEYYSARS